MIDYSISPENILRHRDSMYAVDLIATAILELDFFSWLSENPSSCIEICNFFNICERPTTVMLNLFIANGFIGKENELYSITKTGCQFLIENSPTSLKDYYSSLKERVQVENFLSILKSDTPQKWEGSDKDWHKSMTDEKFARSFIKTMDCRGLYLGEFLSKAVNLSNHSHLLDIGGGSGIYSLILLKKFSHLNATVLEIPTVSKVLMETSREVGISQRMSILSGDMFCDAFPDNIDIHLYSNALHDWNINDNIKLIEKSYQALPSQGMIIIHDAILRNLEDRTVAEYSTFLLYSTEGRCYSVEEYQDILTKIGFENITYKSTTCSRGVITAIKP